MVFRDKLYHTFSLHSTGTYIMATLTLFKSRAPIMGYCFKDGSVVHFINHGYATTNKKHIEELTAECEAGHPNYYIDPNETETTTDLIDPMGALRARIREEERAKILAATDINRDMGETDQSGKLKGIANSQSIQGAMAASNGVAAVPAPASVSVKVSTK
jgi:hypothetical protein